MWTEGTTDDWNNWAYTADIKPMGIADHAAKQLVVFLEEYLTDQIELYRDRFEREPPDEILKIFVARFMEEHYPVKDIPDED